MFPNSHRPVGFMVIDSKVFGQGWEAHSGDNMFASFASGYSPNDDWLISPLLSGQEQEIEFWARSVTTAYGAEVFEVYYSTTDTRLSSFTRCVERTQAPMTWTKYTAILPKDARYFAIRCVSDDTFAFLVDDISFIRLIPTPASLSPATTSIVMARWSTISPWPHATISTRHLPSAATAIV